MFEQAAAATAHRVLGDLGRRPAEIPPSSSLSANVVLGQIRPTIVDLLTLTGASYDEARDLSGYARTVSTRGRAAG